MQSVIKPVDFLANYFLVVDPTSLCRYSTVLHILQASELATLGTGARAQLQAAVIVTGPWG